MYEPGGHSLTIKSNDRLDLDVLSKRHHRVDISKTDLTVLRPKALIVLRAKAAFGRSDFLKLSIYVLIKLSFKSSPLHT